MSKKINNFANNAAPASSATTTTNDKIYMMTQDGCGACEKAKELLKSEISSGKVQEVSVKSEFGKKLLEQFGNSSSPINGTPTMIHENQATHTHQVCLLSNDAKKMKCFDGKEYPIIKEVQQDVRKETDKL